MKGVPEGRNELVPVAGVVEVEQRLESDVAGQLAEFEVYVDGLPVHPAGDHSVGELSHDPGIGEDTGLEECRLGELPLAEPEVALAGDQPVAEYGFVEPGTEMFDVMPGVGDQDFFDEVRVAGQVNPPVGDPEAGQVAVLAGDPDVEVEPAVAKLAEHSEQWRTGRAGRKAGCRHRVRPWRNAGVHRVSGTPECAEVYDDCSGITRHTHVCRS